jgi:dTMP kinase
MRSLGVETLCTREPGEGELGRKIRELLLHGEELSSVTELFLFLADRSHHVEKTILPALKKGVLVLCDRYSDSTWVYQSFASGLDSDFVTSANRAATGCLVPDLTLLLDLPPEVGLSRLQNPDRMDAQPIEFHRKVREGFLLLAEREPNRWRIVDATQDPSSVEKAVFEIVKRQMGFRCG